MEFFRAGGFNMFVLAGFGLVMVPLAIGFARGADAQRLALLRALGTGLIVATLTGFAAGLAATAKFVAREQPSDPLGPLLQGFAESTTNLILGGGILVITYILIAVGVRRMPRDPA